MVGSLERDTTKGSVLPYATSGLVILFFVSFFNYMDRYMLAVLLPAIKADLGLSDTQIGFITGLAFTLFYATMGIPIARLADRKSRKTIIAIALSFWSLMTMLCGLAQNFIQLALARVLVGVGEAGASPPSHSLIADYFPLEKRATAISFFNIGAPVGILVGFLAGGWLTEFFSWRIALITVGAPGILLALVVAWRLVEPPRGHADGHTAEAETPSLLFVFRTLWGNKTFRHISLGTGVYTILWLGVVQWLPSFYVRTHEMSLGTVSTWLAFILGGSQLIGILAGGFVADRLGRLDLRWYAWVPSLAMLGSTPVFAYTFLTDNSIASMISLFFPFMIGVMQGAPTFAIIQGVSDISMRATAAALMLLIANLIGGGLGPQAVGILSDLWANTYAEDSLGYALLWVSLIAGFWAALHYGLASKTIATDLTRRRKPA